MLSFLYLKSLNFGILYNLTTFQILDYDRPILTRILMRRALF
jgi:hypothetical protein